MLIMLFKWLSHYWHTLQVVHYITLRALCAAITALVFSLLFGNQTVRYLIRLKCGQAVRTDGPESHLKKQGTPTMGGILIFGSIVLSTLLWADLSYGSVWLCLIVFSGFGVLGACDDYLKIKFNNSKGISARIKLAGQSLLALGAGIYLYHQAVTPAALSLYVPFFKGVAIPLGLGFIAWVYFMVVGSSNAVNLTDGLDGLAIMPVVLIAGALAIFAYLGGNAYFAAYLHIPHIIGAGEMAIMCASIFGAGLGFLWFNAYPAQMFMGDIGSLSLGALLGLVAVIIRQELVFAWMSGIFILETISVILQVGSYKLRGKRIFKMAPIHHHFELKGWAEPKVIVRFWIITMILVLIGLATLKLR
jgi:phospho-N-acetylmuramoyl-pentapeptide-transferase